MNERRLTVDQRTYEPLLELIASVESNNNYQAYFGRADNQDIKFTDMTIGEVLAWQDDFVKKGNPSSAVGRYQIINTTLDGLVKDLNLSLDQRFDEKTQDMMAIALLERRGAENYINDEITREEFAANLAKEWAALPRVVGQNPEESYYAGDGLNKARVNTSEVLKALAPIASEN